MKRNYTIIVSVAVTNNGKLRAYIDQLLAVLKRDEPNKLKLGKLNYPKLKCIV
jgi:hypothetical protein